MQLSSGLLGELIGVGIFILFSISMILIVIYTPKKLTKNYTEVPLFWVNFNLNKYQKFGSENSCLMRIHPMLKDDTYIYNKLVDITDHIRSTYDMEKLSK